MNDAVIDVMYNHKRLPKALRSEEEKELMKFTDYTFDEDSFVCEGALVTPFVNSLSIEIQGLNPKTFVHMIKQWDDDVIEALIQELRSDETNGA
jgi:hypothetical protein